MRSLQDAKSAWQELKNYHSITELREAVRLDGHSSAAASAGLRSACWKAFLLFESVETAQWPKTLAASRSAYDSLRMHFLRYLENREELEGDFDPLSQHDESSPWATLRKDEDLRAEIQQDVDRCMPENLYFRQSETQRMLLDILFVWCKLNPDVGYRQGMHELLAPLLWVVECDAIDLGPSSKALGEEATVRSVFDAEHIEHDSFALFSQVMQGAKQFYEQTTHHGKENPIVLRSQRIFTDYLPQVDPELAQHLAKVDIVPQVFLMRWIRLLFGREFSRFDDVLMLWDVIIAEDTTLEIVDHICLAMLLRIRWELLDTDYNGCLTLLLRYPEPERDHPAQTFALDALYLRDHLDTDGSGYLVLKYTGRPLIPQDRPATPPALVRNITHFSGMPSLTNTSPSQRPPVSQPGGSRGNIETVLQSTAKNLLARGRSAFDEVHKRAQEIRDAQTPSVPARRVPGAAGAVYARVKRLEDRNRSLAKLLEGAVGQLWEYQKTLADATGGEEGGRATASSSQEKEGQIGGENSKTQTEDLEKLSVAIAKVQFVQVYLEDASLPLPEPENADEKQTQDEGQEATKLGAGEDTAAARSGQVLPISQHTTHGPSQAAAGRGDELADPASFEDEDDTAPSTPPPHKANADAPTINVEDTSAAGPITSKAPPSVVAESPPTVSSPPRPSLAQSNYSWMLGQDDGPDSTTQPFQRSTSVLPEQSRQRGFLFGDGQDAERTGSPSSKRERPRKNKAVGQPAGGEKVGEENVFDLGTLKRS